MRKKILYINKDSFLGGSAKSLLLLLQKIKNYHNVYVVVCQKGVLLKKLKKLNIKTFYVPFKNYRQLKYIFKNLYGILKLKLLIKKIKPDIIHSNSYEVNPLMILASSKKIKTICHLRDVITEKKAKKFLLHKTNLIIVVSKFVKEKIASINKNIKLLYNAVDTSELKKLQKSKTLNKIYYKFKVGIIGNCEERKRQEDFIKAGFQVLKKDFKISFLIIGNVNTPYGKKLKQMVKDFKKNFYFINYTDKIYDIIKNLNILVISSKEEAFGRTAIEAGLLKKPVIATNTGGLKEIIINKKNGLLYNIGDYRQLSKYILFLKNNPKLLKEYGKNNYKRTLKLFTLEKQIKKLLKIYNSL